MGAALRTPGRPGADVLSEANSAVAIEPLWEAARSRTETLTSYAVLFRYPGESATRALAKTALKDAQWVRSMVRSSMRLRGR